jgi:hypothetical protein
MITPASKIGNPAAEAPADPAMARRFAMSQAINENRDQWGRPKIMLPDGSREVGYRRASSYGAPLENDTNLIKWKMRQVARGVARRSSLRLAVTRAETGLDGDWDESRAAKTELNKLCEKAMDEVGSGDKASIGTSLHQMFELVDLGRDPGHVPDEWRPDLDAYRALTEGVFRTLSVERFVVQDSHRVGGTLDRAVEILRPLPVTDDHGNVLAVLEPGSVIIGDVKTSGSMDFAGCKFGVQCWAYATGVPYDPINKVREDWGYDAPRTDWAVIMHVASGSGEGALHWVNLTDAAEAAEHVRAVYAWRNWRGKGLITRGRQVEDFHATCASATSIAELTDAYQRAHAAGAWDDVLKQRFSRRKAELEEASA